MELITGTILRSTIYKHNVTVFTIICKAKKRKAQAMGVLQMCSNLFRYKNSNSSLNARINKYKQIITANMHTVMLQVFNKSVFTKQCVARTISRTCCTDDRGNCDNFCDSKPYLLNVINNNNNCASRCKNNNTTNTNKQSSPIKCSRFYT